MYRNFDSLSKLQRNISGTRNLLSTVDQLGGTQRLASELIRPSGMHKALLESYGRGSVPSIAGSAASISRIPSLSSSFASAYSPAASSARVLENVTGKRSPFESNPILKAAMEGKSPFRVNPVLKAMVEGKSPFRINPALRPMLKGNKPFQTSGLASSFRDRSHLGWSARSHLNVYRMPPHQSSAMRSLIKGATIYGPVVVTPEDTETAPPPPPPSPSPPTDYTPNLEGTIPDTRTSATDATNVEAVWATVWAFAVTLAQHRHTRVVIRVIGKHGTSFLITAVAGATGQLIFFWITN